ncbi:tRNA pseudouridine(55) synthase TruB [Alteromonas sp. a30]|uniref:tRNA pseudouridine(55) synthase TruB n=1 Tax=Alteromonas sp. a30 TaxID=2730917 RepID=UPI00228111D3|nr:tRNA pseudouridine(55) synthase TruB [Alteromonas sp. a30]MCY7295925.1 tRNA pseudouridine(55) synthase TruB [Alteromonas sp. a30]
MGRRGKKGRDIDGVILVDKHLGCSSNHLLQQIKRLYNANKAGHTGSLDPLATGMLPICFGEATKFSQFLLDADKTYEVTAHLGVRTTTSDADGDVVETKPVNVSEEQFMQAIQQFKGTTEQVPSIYSALKYEGKPYYYYARLGIDIPRKSRPITIFQLELLKFDGVNADLRVRCSKGTYIRSLVDDIGQVLGCGAYVTRLHRTEVANYPAEKMQSLEVIQQQVAELDSDELRFETLDTFLLPVDAAVDNFPVVELGDCQSHSLMHGQPVKLESPCKQGIVRIYDNASQRFLGIGQVENGQLTSKRLVSTA